VHAAQPAGVRPQPTALSSANPDIYSGRIDDSHVGDTITSRDLENAVADVVAGRAVAVNGTDLFGCAIVW
jgi:hypothetical protein